MKAGISSHYGRWRKFPEIWKGTEAKQDARKFVTAAEIAALFVDPHQLVIELTLFRCANRKLRLNNANNFPVSISKVARFFLRTFYG